MLSPLTIPNKNEQPLAMDRQQLYELGLKHVQRLSSQIWTDYNLHDPGVTTLELLCYALTDLSYRASLPIEDLLAGNPRGQTFFTPREILPNRALTLLDYRKLLIDIDGVKNAWLYPHPQRYYADTARGELFRDPPAQPNIVPIDLAGLYEVKIQYADDVSSPAEVLGRVQQKLQANRNLGEDFVHFTEVSLQNFQLCAEIELTPDADVTRVNAEILQQVQQYLSPSPRFYSLGEMLTRTKSPSSLAAIAIEDGGQGYTSPPTVALRGGGGSGAIATATVADGEVTAIAILSGGQGYTSPPRVTFSGGGGGGAIATATLDGTPYRVDEIFDGPALDHGFIDDTELENTDLRKEIRLSDLISLIMDIEGVRTVRDLLINPTETTVPLADKWLIPVETGKQARLDTSKSRLVFYKRNMPVIPDRSRSFPPPTLPAIAEAEDFPLPEGQNRQLSDYYSFQNHFPAIYGLSEAGLSEAVGKKRQALAYQLKAYLLFFDQIMANYLAQLHQVKELFSLDPDLQHTYYYQVVNSFAEYQKIYTSENAIDTLQIREWEREKATRFDRRNRFLDHLIARFAERFHDLMYTLQSRFGASPEEMIRAKCEFLQNYPAISRDRSLAYNYTLADPPNLWDSENISGFEKRLAKLLAIADDRRRDLANIDYQIISVTPTQFRFEIKNKDTQNVLLESTAIYPTSIEALEAMKSVINFGQSPQGYRRVNVAGGYRFIITDENGNEIARSIHNFSTEALIDNQMNSTFTYLNRSFEGMYVLENLLFRPELLTDDFLTICPDPNCTDCPEVDPYSYRLQIILPGYGPRFGYIEFRRFAEEVIREETPAHILPKVCWIDKGDMTVIEKLYRNWIYLKAGADTTRRSEKLRELIRQLFSVKNVYPRSRLRKCDSPENQNKFILGRTALGSSRENTP
jgi:uncharacterized protein